MKGLIKMAKGACRYVAPILTVALVLALGNGAFATDPTITPPVAVAGYATSLGESLGTVITAAIGVGLGIFVVFAGIGFLKRLARA